MSQALTPELSSWLAAQRQAGHGDSAILAAMLQSGWSPASAQAALAQPTPVGKPPEPSQGTFTVGLPEPAVSDGAMILNAGDRDVQVLALMPVPRVVALGGLLSSEECVQLQALAAPRLARSETVNEKSGGSEVHAARTSEGMFFGRGETPLIQRIEARIAALLHWPVENGEGLQVLRYGVGAEYKPHYDYFDPVHASTPSILKRGGQRVGTVVIYLNTPTRGGATTFPDVGLEVQPIQGNAVFFSYSRADPSTGTLHGGAPVVEGEKWVATKWLRQGLFV